MTNEPQKFTAFQPNTYILWHFDLYTSLRLIQYIYSLHFHVTYLILFYKPQNRPVFFEKMEQFEELIEIYIYHCCNVCPMSAIYYSTTNTLMKYTSYTHVAHKLFACSVFKNISVNTRFLGKICVLHLLYIFNFSKTYKEETFYLFLYFYNSSQHRTSHKNREIITLRESIEINYNRYLFICCWL